jgi:drug/metabolite transporter (DMT)-like permease
MPNRNLNNFLFLNLSILAISTSGLLGRSIGLIPVQAIFWRASLAALLFLLLLRWQKIKFWVKDKKDLGTFLLGGLLMGIHWVTYFQSLQLSSVAIGMLSLFTYPVITAFLEPILLKTRFQAAHLLLSLLTLLGLYMLLPDFDLGNQQVVAVGFGLLSATTYAFRNVLMKPMVTRYASSHIMTYQMLITSLLLFPYLLWQGFGSIETEWPSILFLALITTVVGHTLFLYSFRNFSVTTASIFSSLQPIYGIILAAIFLREYPDWNIYIGGGLILLAVVVENLRNRV